jgi:hypothetical protein
MSDGRDCRSGASEKSICESGRPASRFGSLRRLLLMGVVKSALAGTRLSCRDDTDFFFTMFCDSLAPLQFGRNLFSAIPLRHQTSELHQKNIRSTQQDPPEA